MAGGVGIEQPKSLQSICYKRGSLQLLDQRKLPLETTYLDIRDMVLKCVRGLRLEARLEARRPKFASEAAPHCKVMRLTPRFQRGLPRRSEVLEAVQNASRRNFIF